MFTIQEIVTATGGRLARGGQAGQCGGISTDSRTIRPGDIFVAIKGDTFDGHDFIPAVIPKGAACIVYEEKRLSAVKRAAGNDCAFVCVKDSIQAFADIARFHRRRFVLPLIAVTGSNGKTTTKDMCAWVLGTALRVVATEGTKNNHIGVPLTLLRLDAGSQAAVLELGSNHFGEIGRLARTCEPTIGVITAIGPSHLENFVSLAGVYREKKSLLDNLGDPAIAIVNNDDPYLERTVIAKKRKPFIISIGIKGRADFRGRSVAVRGGRVAFTIDGRRFSLTTPGSYNVYNALAACAVARIMGMGYGQIASRLADFEFPGGRLKVVRRHGTTFIDDSYNSSPASLSAALGVFKKFKAAGRKILVMGDMLELGRRQDAFHLEALRQAARVCDVLVTVGNLSRSALEVFRREAHHGGMLYACDTAREARDVVLEKLTLTKHDVVLVKGSRRMGLDLIVK
jgi:UDP-N-acetylmuramoyl-tripeptide--D-alanyl-D-alanine ligase